MFSRTWSQLCLVHTELLRLDGTAGLPAGQARCLCPMPSGLHAEASGLVPPTQNSGGCTFFSFSIPSPHALPCSARPAVYSLSHKYPSLPLGVLTWLPLWELLPLTLFILCCFATDLDDSVFYLLHTKWSKWTWFGNRCKIYSKNTFLSYIFKIKAVED